MAPHHRKSTREHRPLFHTGGFTPLCAHSSSTLFTPHQFLVLVLVAFYIGSVESRFFTNWEYSGLYSCLRLTHSTRLLGHTSSTKSYDISAFFAIQVKVEYVSYYRSFFRVCFSGFFYGNGCLPGTMVIRLQHRESLLLLFAALYNPLIVNPLLKFRIHPRLCQTSGLDLLLYFLQGSNLFGCSHLPPLRYLRLDTPKQVCVMRYICKSSFRVSRGLFPGSCEYAPEKCLCRLGSKGLLRILVHGLGLRFPNRPLRCRNVRMGLFTPLATYRNHFLV